MGGGGFYAGREDAQAFDATICGGHHLNAHSGVIEHHNLAAQRNASLDLTDESAEGCCFELVLDINRLPEEVDELIDDS